MLIRIGHSLSLICQPTSEDIKLYIIIIIYTVCWAGRTADDGGLYLGHQCFRWRGSGVSLWKLVLLVARYLLVVLDEASLLLLFIA